MKKKGQLEIMIPVFILLFVAAGIIISFNWAWISSQIFTRAQTLGDIDQQITSLKKSYIRPAQKFSLMQAQSTLGAQGGFYDASKAVKSDGGVPFWSISDPVDPSNNKIRIPFRHYAVDEDKSIGTFDPALFLPGYDSYTWIDFAGELPSKQVLVGIAVKSCSVGSKMEFYIDTTLVKTLVYTELEKEIKTGEYVVDMPGVVGDVELILDKEHTINLDVIGDCVVYFKQFSTSIYGDEVVGGSNKVMTEQLNEYMGKYDNPNKATVGLYSTDWNSLIYPNKMEDGADGVFWTANGIAGKSGALRVKENYIDEVGVDSEYWKIYDYAVEFVKTDLNVVHSGVENSIKALVDKRKYNHQVSEHNSDCGARGYSYTCETLIDSKVAPVDFWNTIQTALDGIALGIKGNYPDTSGLKITLKKLEKNKDPAWVGDEIWMENPGSWNTYSNLRTEYYECDPCYKDCGRDEGYPADKHCTNCYSYCEYYYAGHYTAEVKFISKPMIGGDNIEFKFNVEGFFEDKDALNSANSGKDECYGKTCYNDCHNKYCCEWDRYCGEIECGEVNYHCGSYACGTEEAPMSCPLYCGVDYDTACECTGKWTWVRC